MTYSPLNSVEVTTGAPLDEATLVKIKRNFDSHNQRIASNDQAIANQGQAIDGLTIINALPSPSLILDFAKTNELDSRITFIRDSVATYVNSKGLIKKAKPGSARFDFNPSSLKSEGLLLEEKRTNMLAYTSAIGHSYWAKGRSSAILNAAIAPDGTMTASKIIEDTATGTHYVEKSIPAFPLIGKTLTWSVFVKKAERNFAYVETGNYTNWISPFMLIINLESGEYNVSRPEAEERARVEKYPDGWWRVSLTGTINSAPSGNCAPRVGTCLDYATPTYQGDNTSGIYVWGAQFEEGDKSTSYIPSTETLASRPSRATFFGEDGLLKIAEPNFPRYDYNEEVPSLIVEQGSQNLLLNTQYLDKSPWLLVRSSLKLNDATAPDGTMTATKLVENAVGSTHYLTQRNMPVVIGEQLAVSVFVKAAERTKAFFGLLGTGMTNTKGAYIDLSTNTVGGITSNVSAVKIEKLNNDWVRLSCIITAVANGNAEFIIAPAMETFSNGFTYAGDGTSGIYVWGPQVERGSQVTSYIPSENTFTSRNSIGTYIDSSGLIARAGINQKRLSHDSLNPSYPSALLLENAATNLISYPEDFTNNYWNYQNVTVIRNIGKAPDNTVTANKITEGTGTGQKILKIRNNPVIPSSSTVSVSVFVKAGERTKCQLRAADPAFIGRGIFDLEAGTIALSENVISKIEEMKDGWYRISITYTTKTTGTVAEFNLGPIQNGGNWGIIDYIGDGTSGIYAWGAQLEIGSYPTSYIPSDPTFTSRDSVATYIGSDGLIKVAGVNQQRNNYNHLNLLDSPKLLLEDASSNMLSYTENLGENYWVKQNCTVARNIGISPSGHWDADKLVSDNVTGNLRIYNSTINFVEGQPYTFSLYVKKSKEYRYMRMALGATVNVFFDVTDGVVARSNGASRASIEYQGNDWYRAVVTIDSYPITQTSLVEFRIARAENSSTNVVGDGLSGLHFWGLQLENKRCATSYIPSIDTFISRSTVGTYIDSTGRNISGTGNRLSFNPTNNDLSPKVLFEDQRTNLLTQSNNLAVSPWYNGHSTIVSQSMPDSPISSIAFKFNDVPNSDPHVLNQAVSVTQGKYYTFSVFAKAGTKSALMLNLGDPYVGSQGHAVFNLLTGESDTIVGKTEVVPFPNGWYRCSWTAEMRDTGNPGVQFAILNEYNLVYGKGIYYSADGNGYLFLAGAQFEEGKTASSYIPTTTAAVTRAADVFSSVPGIRAADVYTSVSGSRAEDIYTASNGTRSGDITTSSPSTRERDIASINQEDFTSWYNHNEGSFFVTAGLSKSVAQQVMCATDDLLGGYVRIHTTVGAGGVLRGAVSTDKVVQYDTFPIGEIFETNKLQKMAISYSSTKLGIALSGNVNSITGDKALPKVDKLRFMSSSNGLTGYNGHIAKMQYYPKALTNEELQLLTK